MTRKKKNKKEEDRISFFYKFLPLFLYLGLFLNLWFVFSFVKREKEDFSSLKDSAFNDVSNMYHFVQHSLSNELLKVRMTQSRYSMPYVYHTSSNGIVTSSIEQTKTNSVDNTSLLVHGESIPYRYFAVNGQGSLQFEDGSIFNVGDDFGYGRIDKISHEIVVCEGRSYKRDRNFNLRRVDTFKSHDTFAMQRPDFVEGYHDELQFRQYERNVENSMRGLSSSQYNVPRVQMKEGM